MTRDTVVNVGHKAGCRCVVAAAVASDDREQNIADITAMRNKGLVVKPRYGDEPVQVRSCPHATVYIVEADGRARDAHANWVEAVYNNKESAASHAAAITNERNRRTYPYLTYGTFKAYGILTEFTQDDVG